MPKCLGDSSFGPVTPRLEQDNTQSLEMEKTKSPETCFLHKIMLMRLEYYGEEFWERRAETVTEDLKKLDKMLPGQTVRSQSC